MARDGRRGHRVAAPVAVWARTAVPSRGGAATPSTPLRARAAACRHGAATDRPRTAPPRSPYLHVPFCPQVCPYCVSHKMRRDPALATAYVARVSEEATELAARWPGPLDTVYLGGGTPSHLTDDELDAVLAAIARGWGGLGAVETTLEAGLAASADVITAVPGQGAERDLRAVAASGAGHISVYTLTIEAQTPFARRGVRVDDERAADDYDLAERVLGEHGFERHEVSNHARPGQRSRHNPVYWRGDACLALGPGAAGLLPPGPDDPAGTVAVRTMHPTLRGDPTERTPLDGHALALEQLMTGLRNLEGVDLAALERSNGVDVERRFPEALAVGLRHGLLVVEGQVLRATRDGTRVLDAVLRRFFAEAAP